MSEEKSKGPGLGLVLGVVLGIGLGLLFREMAIGIVCGAVLGVLLFGFNGRATGRGRRE